MTYNNFDKINISVDILKEIGNIGSGNAVTSLSKLLNKKFEMKVPRIKIVELNKLLDMIGGSENIIISIIAKVYSTEIKGMVMFLTEEKNIKLIIDDLFKEYKINIKSNNNIDTMNLSALCEIGNIIISSYLSAISNFFDTKLNYTISNICTDMAGAILSVPAIEFTEMYDKLLFIESVFLSNKENINGYFLFIPDLKSLKFISSHLAKL